MAIAFARPEYVSRSKGGNACCKSAYNARAVVKDLSTGIVYNFQNRKDNVYHVVLLPEYVDERFKDVALLANTIEGSEKRKDSQLCVEWVIALPKEEEITLAMKQELVEEFVSRKGWVQEGLGVQIDIHKPHSDDINWHAHLLVTTRRFRKEGLGFESSKARDLQPEVLKGFVQKNAEIDNHNFYRQVLKDKIKEWGLDIKVDLPGELTQEHVGPVRMRSVLNQAAMRNEERRVAEMELLHSGRRVLEKVTHHMSVFTKGDLERAVKVVPDEVRREELVKEALGEQSVLELFKEDGSKSGYFTTRDVRKEELKIFRLSGYIARGDNVFSLKYSKGNVNESNRHKDNKVSLEELVENYGSCLTEEQYIVFKEIITSKSGLSIVRGRAGVGKSHVLGCISRIAKASGIEVIGLTPTHKAKEALVSSGFERTDTVKGMLFRLKNGRFLLPKHSLLVVDEAGMIGNEDYLELLRVAATRKCQVILSGDERQLSSVARGGMFSSFAAEYGSSTILDIRRQSSDWGRAVAKAFSKGEVERGIKILEENEKIVCHQDRSESMQGLLSEWHKSSYALDHRLIISVKNKDVSSLNHGVREYLKLEGILKGKEIEVNGHYYMAGDKVMMTSNNKKLGVLNGDIGVITSVSQNKFAVRMVRERSEVEEKKEKIIEFNPKEYSRFKHGYAVTVFKSQGATIRDVYVYHSGFAGLRNGYVALSRNKHEVKLYINKEDTLNRSHLIRQLSYDPDSGSSLSLYLKEEVENVLANREYAKNSNLWDKLVTKAYNFIDDTAAKLLDKYLPESEYYNYREEIGEEVKVREIFEALHKSYHPNEQERNTELKQRETVQEGPNQEKKQEQEKIHSKIEISKQEDRESNMVKKAGNDNNYNHHHNKALSSKQSKKERFYAKADYLRNRDQKKEEIESLRGELTIKSELIVRGLLGEPNGKLSSNSMLRYGNNGSLTVKVSGERSGMWYDFSRGEGGDLFDLVRKEKQLDFKGSVDYLKDQVGGSRLSFIGQVEEHELYNKYVFYHQKVAKEESIESAKIRLAQKLYKKSKAIDQNSVVSRYLSEVRKIDIGIVIDNADRDESDIRSAIIYNKQEKQEYPVLIAFARNDAGEITGGQQIFLDSITNDKAAISIPKKSFGKIAGSFVEVSSNSESKVTIIAEGIETTLSLGSAGIEGRILCSLGISNIKHYPAKLGEKVIIAADNDGSHHITTKAIEKAKELLSSKGAAVEVIKPEKPGDFNDLLQEEGSDAIRNKFASVLELEKQYQFVIKRLSSLNDIKQEAKTPLEVLQAVVDEQKYLASLYEDDHFKSGRYGREMEITITSAYESYREREAEKLNKSLYYVCKEKILSEESIVSSLKIDMNLNTMRFFINQVCENYHKELFKTNKKKLEGGETIIDKGLKFNDVEGYLKYYQDNVDRAMLPVVKMEEMIDQNGKKKEINLKEAREHLQELKYMKQVVITSVDAVEMLTNENKFLASLYGSNSSSGKYSEEMKRSIYNAYELEREGESEKLEASVSYALKAKILSGDEIINYIREDQPLDKTRKKINKVCEDYHKKILDVNIEKLEGGETITDKGHSFDNVVEYLKYYQDNVDRGMLPINKMQKRIDADLEKDKRAYLSQESLDQYMKSEDKNNSYPELLHLANINNSKKIARNLVQVMSCITREQRYLASLYKVPSFKKGEYSEHLSASIEKAYELHNTGQMDKLKKTVMYIHKEKIMSQDELLGHLKADEPLNTMHDNIKEKCQDHHLEILKMNCKKIEEGEMIIDKSLKFTDGDLVVEGLKFNDVGEYLNYYKHNFDHELLPMKYINHTLKAIEKDHGYGMEMSL